MTEMTNRNDPVRHTRIVIDPDVMLGRPVVRGTRIPVDLVLRKLSRGTTEGELLDAYPNREIQDIRATIAYAADVVALDERIL